MNTNSCHALLPPNAPKVKQNKFCSFIIILEISRGLSSLVTSLTIRLSATAPATADQTELSAQIDTRARYLIIFFALRFHDSISNLFNYVLLMHPISKRKIGNEFTKRVYNEYQGGKKLDFIDFLST